MAGKKLIVTLFTVFAMVLASQAAVAGAVVETLTPAISWLYVQHRTYENGTTKNLLAFGFKDAVSGANLLEDKLHSAKLYFMQDDEAIEVAVSDPVFYGPYTEISGEYDGKTGIWNYSKGTPIADYTAIIEEALMAGTYRLVAVYDGTEVQATFSRTVEAVLPVVKASSITRKVDALGNLICTWPVSFDLSDSNPTLATSVKVVIEVKKRGVAIADVGYRVPTHLGRLFVPKSVVDTLKGFGGGSYSVKVNVRTNDNGTRTSSDVRKLILP